MKLWDLAAGRSMATLTNHKKSVRGDNSCIVIFTAFIAVFIATSNIQGVFFDWSSLNLAMFKSLYKIPYSNIFSRIYH